MEWDHERCLELINIYKSKPELWDPKHSWYHSKSKKQDALNYMASSMNTTTDIIKAKLNSLTTSFRRERAKEQNHSGTGRGQDEVYKSQWFAYKAFAFLLNKTARRKTLTAIVPNKRECKEENVEASGSNDSQIATQNFDELSGDEGHIICYEPETVVSLADNLYYEQPPTSEGSNADALNARGLKWKNLTNKIPNEDPHIGKEFQIVQSCVQERDSCAVYGEHVALKLRTYSRRTQNIVQHLFSNIIFNADMGHYDRTEPGGLYSNMCNSTVFSPSSSDISYQPEFPSKDSASVTAFPSVKK